MSKRCQPYAARAYNLRLQRFGGGNFFVYLRFSQPYHVWRVTCDSWSDIVMHPICRVRVKLHLPLRRMYRHSEENAFVRHNSHTGGVLRELS